MAITLVKNIVGRVEKILNDEGGVRWTRLEIQDWINDAYKEIILQRPDANSSTSTVLLSTGTHQKLSVLAGIVGNSTSSPNIASALRILDITRNIALTSTRRAIRLVPRNVFDEQSPTWHNDTPDVTIRNWMFDERTPKEFFVYPPATALSEVEIAYSSVPTPHALIATALDPAGADLTPISIDDIYANAIADYVLYRCYSKDAEYGSNGQRAVNAINAFNSSLGVKTRVDMANAPSVTMKSGQHTAAINGAQQA